MDNIKTIFFDADDTLWHDSIYFRRLQDFLLNGGIRGTVTKEKFAEEILRQTNLVGSGENSYSIAVRNAAIKLGCSSHFVALLDIEIKAFLSHPIELFDHVEETLKNLAGKQKILLTKGIYREQIRKLITSNCLDYFDNVIVLEKKNAKNLKSLLELFNLRSNECLLVGNSIKHDIIPAVANNIHCIWFNHENNFYGVNEILPNEIPEVKNWKEICEIISPYK